MTNRLAGIFDASLAESPYPCPRCGSDAIGISLGHENWGACNTCHCRWRIGYGMWCLNGDETNTTFEKNAAILALYEPFGEKDVALEWDRWEFAPRPKPDEIVNGEERYYF